MSKLQNLMFYKAYWNIRNIHKFLEKHMIVPIKPIHTTANYYRVRIQIPKKSYTYRTITIQKYPLLKAVVMI